MTDHTEYTLTGGEAADLLLCSFRYAIGRRTYITSTVTGLLRRHWAVVPKPWQELIHREINEAIGRDGAGDPCDIESWESVLALPVSK